MFNKDTLQQLSNLKNTLRIQRELFQGSVRTTSKRFGFVKLDDGREAFIDPDQMMRVLPDDRIEVELKTNEKKQLEARLEKLVSSPLREFVGKYVRKGSAHFVEPDLPMFSRWIFLPPQERTNCAEGDLVLCEIIRHPFHSEGKAQARIISRIGKPDDAGIESRYIAAKHQLPNEWSQEALAQTSEISATPFVQEPTQQDFTHLPFVTIDSENTRDIDDAIYIEEKPDGWLLVTAIADPSRHIAFESPLEKSARARASTVYLLGQTITMLPVELSHDTYSLVPQQKRPALTCHINIATNGSITGYTFSEAIIESRCKLSYQGVSDFLMQAEENQAVTEIPDSARSMLKKLHGFAAARIDYRLQNALVMEERADYFYMLNEQKKIDRVEKRERNIAHRVVEEAMLATNICAGELFLQHPSQGIFSTHIGFRTERVNDALGLIQEDKPDLIPGDITQLNSFQTLFRELRLYRDQDGKSASLLSILQRMLQAGALSFKPVAHFGLGFPAYATVTSPIRRYNDFYNHLAIKRILRNESPLEAGEKLTEQLQEQLAIGRQACRQLELWLICQYMKNHLGSVHTGTITLINSTGLGVKLEDLGAEGFVTLAPKEKENALKPVFDSRRLSLTLGDKTYRLDQPVAVMVAEVDIEKRRIALTLVDSDIADRLSVWSE